jgi:hypothetical protein
MQQFCLNWQVSDTEDWLQVRHGVLLPSLGMYFEIPTYVLLLTLRYRPLLGGVSTVADIRATSKIGLV